MPPMSSKSPKKMSRSASIEHGRCYARVFTRVLEWKGKKHSIFMRCGVIELLRMCLKEFRSTIRTRTTPRPGCSDGRALKLQPVQSFRLPSRLGGVRGAALGDGGG